MRNSMQTTFKHKHLTEFIMLCYDFIGSVFVNWFQSRPQVKFRGIASNPFWTFPQNLNRDRQHAYYIHEWPKDRKTR